MASFVSEKQGLAEPLPTASASSSASTSVLHSLAAPLQQAYDGLQSWKSGLNLLQPGTSENLTREVKTTHLTNFFFDGARADLTKSLALNPAFQVTHAFTLGGMQNGGPMGPVQNAGNYSFSALYASNDVFAQGSIEQDASMMGRLNYSWSPGSTSKVQVQLAPTPSAPSMVQFEHDYLGTGYSLSAKALNPSLADGTGIFIGSYLQALSSKFAAGFEGIYQRPDPSIEDFSTSLLVKGTGGQRDRPYIWTGQLQPAQAVAHATYWQRLGDKVEAGAELTLALGKRSGQATLGAKYDFRMATFRAQLDSGGKVSALLEQRFTPAFAFTVGGEIDHLKNTSRWGFGVSLESTSPELEAIAQSGAAPPVPPM